MFQHQGQAHSPHASGSLDHIVGRSEDAFRYRRGRRWASQKRPSTLPAQRCCADIRCVASCLSFAALALVSVLVISSITDTSGTALSLTLCPGHVPATAPPLMVESPGRSGPDQWRGDKLLGIQPQHHDSLSVMVTARAATTQDVSAEHMHVQVVLTAMK